MGHKMWGTIAASGAQMAALFDANRIESSQTGRERVRFSRLLVHLLGQLLD